MGVHVGVHEEENKKMGKKNGCVVVVGWGGAAEIEMK